MCHKIQCVLCTDSVVQSEVLQPNNPMCLVYENIYTVDIAPNNLVHLMDRNKVLSIQYLGMVTLNK